MADFREDASHLENALLGMGTKHDPHEHTFVRRNQGYPKQVLDAFYRRSWACRRVVEIMPRFMCRKWGKPVCDSGDIKLIEQLQELHQKLKVRKKFKVAQYWANLYGRCHILMDDGNENLTEPIEEGAGIQELIILDRHKLYPDPSLPTYSRLNAEQYTFLQYDAIKKSNLILSGGNNWNIHKSRVLVFVGNELPDDEKIRNSACEASILEPFIDVWVRFFTGYASLSKVLNDFDLFVHEIDGLFEALWTGGVEAERKLQDRLSVNQASKSVYRGYAIDKDKEKLGYISRNLSGTGDVADRLQSELVAASGFPKSVLFGEFAAGLDASGKITGEQRFLNELVEEAQVDKFTDNLNELNRLLSATFTNKKFGWQWHPLYSETSQGIAQIRKLYAEIDEININNGIYSQEDARSRYEGQVFEEEITLNKNQDDGGVRLADLERVGGRVRFRSKLYTLNKPYFANGSMQVLASRNGYVKIVKFTSADVRQNALVDNPYSPTYWANLFFNFEKTQPVEDDATPTKKVITWQGFEIGLQYLPFEKRHNKLLLAGYGHFRRTKGADKMACDVYVGLNLDSPKLFVIEQVINGEFDEEKFIIGVNTMDEARGIYLSAMPAEFLGSIREEQLSYLQSMKCDSSVTVGTQVSWQWGKGRGTGKVENVTEGRVTKQIKGSTISRNGTPSNPVLEIEQENGDRVLKLLSEVSRIDADTITLTGELLSEEEFAEISEIEEEDIQSAIANWQQIAPKDLSNILTPD